MSAEMSECERTQSLEDIRDSGHHLLNLINDILDLSKVEAGRMVMVYEEFSLVSMIDAVLTVCETLASQQCKCLHLHATVELPLDTINSDSGRVRQILYNLVSNAVKFTPDGDGDDWRSRGGRPAHRAGDRHRDRHRSREQGTDFRGVPTNRQFIGSLLSRYGTGLGPGQRSWCICSGGEVWVDSVVGEGSTFTFTLPR